MLLKTTLRYLVISLFVVLIDQASKYWAYLKLRTGADITIIPGFFKLSYTENPGIAFGMLSEAHGSAKVWLLSAVSLVAIVLVIYFALKSPPDKRRLLAALMLVLGGIAGNLIDRVH